MVKKDDNEPDMAHFNIRCSMKMRMDAENAAKEAGQSIAEWIRRAIQKELDARERDQSVKAGGVFVSYDELDAYIEKFLDRKMKETRARNDAKRE